MPTQDMVLETPSEACSRCPRNGEPIVYGKKAAAKKLGVSINLLEKQAQARAIPITWCGRAYGWTEAQLLEIAALWEERPAAETRRSETRRSENRRSETRQSERRRSTTPHPRKSQRTPR